MSVAMVRDLYEYHRWANHRLFDVAAALGEDACARDMGKQFSVPTLARMFAPPVRRRSELAQALEGLVAQRVALLRPGLDGRGPTRSGTRWRPSRRPSSRA